MKFIPVLIIAAVTFGLCFVIDKLFHKILRGKKQHKSGFRVKLSKRYATFGVILTALGIVALISLHKEWLFLISGILLLIIGLCLIIFYLSFGIYYDDESFLYSTLGRRTTSYRFCDIKSQQIYTGSAQVVIELILSDGCSLQLQSTMDGVYPFLDKAFQGWLKQKDLTVEKCPYYDPTQHRWFPSDQEE